MLYKQAVEPDVLELLKALMQRGFLQQFVLVGGTALALQIGHRKSIDLDLFTVDDFDSKNLIPALLEEFDIKPISQMTQTLICSINRIKVDFIRFRYPIIRPIVIKEHIRMLDIEDIAAMKLDAITGRGSKKDFFDLYFLLNIFDFNKLFDLYLEKYPHQSTFHVVRSLTYFVDAENDPDPVVFDKEVTWHKVKTRILGEIRQL